MGVLRGLVVTKKRSVGSCSFQRGLQTTTFILPELAYDYGDLEPAISGEIMKLHHQTYITNYNKALDQLDAAISKSDSNAIAKLHTAIRFNGGGHINHSIFYLRFRKEEVKGSFGGAIDAQFGSLEALVGLLYRVLDGCSGLVWTKN